MGKVTRTSSPMLAKFQTGLKDLEDQNCKVGWFDSAKYEDGTPVAYVATIQEFGAETQGIPPRPFMRPTIAEKQPDWKTLMSRGARAAVKGQMSATDVLNMLGHQAVGDIQHAIATLTDPPLSPLTLAIRKHLKDFGTIKGGKDVGKVAKGLRASMEYGPPDLSGVSTKPLVFSSLMFTTLTHVVGTEK